MPYNGKILIIDDDGWGISMLTDALTGAGYKNITGITDPAEGVRVFSENEFDVVLLDYLMPGMDGVEVVLGFRERRGDHGVPIIIITALDDQEQKKIALRAGALEFMKKPYDVDEVLIRVENCISITARHKRKCVSYDLLAEELGEEKAELNQAKKKTLELLGAAAAFRDCETGEHNLRIGTYSAVLGRALGLSGREVSLLEQTAPLHDLGKVAVPDSILLKNGTLSLSERETIEEHPITGGKILSSGSGELLICARTIALSHHEKWDGTGYPFGTKGEAIPLAGRIVAVVDVFDAMLSRRPYKEPCSWEETTETLKQERGTHFDPVVVDAFFSEIDQFKRILCESRDPNLLKLKC